MVGAMARPKKLTIEQRTELLAKALPLLGGVTIQPEKILVGRAEIRKSIDAPLEASQLYAAVNTYSGLPFVIRVQGEPITVVNTWQSWIAKGRRDLTDEGRESRLREDNGRFKPGET